MDNTKPSYAGLYKTPVFYVDSSETSPNFFQIKEFPTQFNAGKNIFKLHGHYQNLREKSELHIEILDYENKTVYFELADDVDEDGSLTIVVYINQSTPNGACTVTIIGEAQTIDLVPVPIEWQYRNNIMWQRTVLVNSTKTNSADITFNKKPTITIQEQVSVQLNRIYNTTQTVIYNTGSVRLNSKNDSPLLTVINGNFTSDMIGGTITVNTPINPLPVSKHITGSIPYQSIIATVLSTSSILLRDTYLIDRSQSLYGHRYDTFDASLYSIKYEAAPVYVPTENSESYALIEINDLQPVTGDITRIKVFANNSGTIGDWDLLSDVELNDIEIFVTSTASIEPYQPIGIIKSSSIIDTYYESASYDGFNIITGPSLLYNNTNLPNSLYINSQRDISARNNVDVVKIKDQYSGKFIKGASYKLSLTAIGNRTTNTGNTDPTISFYLSGSAFSSNSTNYFNHELPIKVGKYIGNLYSKHNTERFDNVNIKFTADKTGTGILYYLIEGGQWQIADIRLTTNNEPGYTPNYTRIRTKIPTTHKSGVQQLFKVEYYNSRGVKGEYSTISDPIDWKGGNHYIDGDHNLVTGSLFVADKLSSGIEFSGRTGAAMIRTVGYTGISDKNKGMMIWSGSALSGSATDYNGTGLELYSSDDNYFRFATGPAETKSLYIKTETFHFGNSSSFISSDGGTITMSGSVIFNTVTATPTASYAFTASYYTETDPIFTGLSGSLATTGSNSFIGQQTIQGLTRIVGTSTNELVRITQTGTGDALRVEDDTNPDSSPFIIDAFGNVGIGNPIPNAKLDVSGSVIISGSLTVSGSLLGTASWAVNSITASFANNAATSSYYTETDPVFVAKSGSFATTGSNAFKSSQTISGSLTITNDLIVLGSSSIQYLTSSQLNISTNIINVNTNTPAVRFGGLAVNDSGSSPIKSGSILFDSRENQWLFVHQSGAGAVTSSLFIMGPETYNSVGSETYPTTNRILKSLNAEHVGDSNITDTGTKVSINSNTEITGSIIATAGFTGSFSGSFNGTATSASFAQTASYALSANPVNIGNTDLTITTNETRVFRHDGDSRFIISGSQDSIYSLLELKSPVIGNNRLLTMQQQINGESTRYARRSFTAGGDSPDSVVFNNWSTDSIFEVNNDNAVAPNILRGFQWAIFNGTDYILPLNISSSGNIGINTTAPKAKLDVNGNVIVTGSLTVTTGITASAFITNHTLITSTTLTANTGITTIYSIPTASYDGAWFDYTIRSGSNARAGTIFGLWSGSAVNYAETTTTDFGSTANFTFGMSINGSNMILSSSTTTNGWTVNSIIRSI